MRLGVMLEMGEDRGDAKLAGSRGVRLGEPAWEMRSDGRLADCTEKAGPPVNLAEGVVMRRWLLTDVWE